MKTTAAVLRAVADRRPYGESRPMSLEEVELGAPRAGELLVRIEAAGVCHSDVSVVDGSRVRPLPMALGHEAAGVVEEAGPGVRDVKAGDHVVLTFVPSCGLCAECSSGRPALCIPAAAANGAGTLLHGPSLLRDREGKPIHHHLGVSGFARHAVVARESAVVVPRDVPLPTAALFGCAVLTGAGAVLNTAGVRPGQSVAVFGLGGVGLASVMGAAVASAWPIVAVDPVEAKRKLALELGATAAFAPEQAEQGIKDLTGGGVEVAFEAAGVPAVLEAAFKAARRGGTTVAMGLPHPSKTLSLPALAFAGLGQALIGSYMGSSAPQRDIPRYLALWKARRMPVERLQSATLPLDRINDAFESLAAGVAVRQVLLPHG
ncbi:MAG TPA: alcohol dehydrogenase catalytic domain-containing protein [Anaeromyxobacteraceae bacterium]|nr:alcohol dehydrogenase catalytic domain-containing protein [Anaeromyxobacteraceae bacterium]